ncbi:MAG: MOSC domain-containing protein, partial [Euzebya sp.]
MTHGRVTAVCVTRDLQSRTRVSTELTGINKAAVDQISLTPVGVRDDQVLDTNDHGGVDKAAYVYADEDAGWWSEELGIQIPPGRFGENLRVRAMPVSDAVIGERWQMGSDVVVEVSEPRVPCSTFQHHMDDRRGWGGRFPPIGRPHNSLRVPTHGCVQARET